MSDLEYSADLGSLRAQERELQAMAMRASTAEMGPAVFPNWQRLWYLDVIADHMDACLRYVRGLPNGLRRIICACPFQHAKTTITEMFVARALGIDPSLRIVNASYGVALARERIDNTQRWMSNSAYLDAFQTRFGVSAAVEDDDGNRKARGNDKVRNTANAFQVRTINDRGELENRGGSFLSTSLGAGLNGRPYDIGIIDDPHKNMEEAASETARRHVEERYDAIFLSRQQERSIQIICTTRMNPDDLVAHVVPKWIKSGIPHAVLRFPAILDEEPASYDPRPQGHGLAQALYPGGPEKYSAETYRVMKIDQPPHIWETCYQQRPTTRTGDYFQDSWWRYFDPSDLTEVDKFWVSIDCASKAAGASWTCADLWASKGPAAFKLDELRGHWDVRQFERELMTWITDKWGREVRRNGSAILIEDGGYGRTIHDDLVAAGVSSMHLLGTGGLSKQARASLALDFVRNGLAFLPSRSEGRVSMGWVGEHKAEYARFPQPPCDRVDAGTQALRWHIDWLRGPG